MLSTLYLLILTGIFTQYLIKTSTNHIIQLNQLSSSYQAKATLNLSEQLLKDNIAMNNGKRPRTGIIESSIGKVVITQASPEEYEIVLTEENGEQFSKIIKLASPEQEISETLNKKKIDF